MDPVGCQLSTSNSKSNINEMDPMGCQHRSGNQMIQMATRKSHSYMMLYGYCPWRAFCSKLNANVVIFISPTLVTSPNELLRCMPMSYWGSCIRDHASHQGCCVSVSCTQHRQPPSCIHLGYKVMFYVVLQSATRNVSRTFPYLSNIMSQTPNLGAPFISDGSVSSFPRSLRCHPGLCPLCCITASTISAMHQARLSTSK